MEENLEFHIKVSYFEIYMDKIRDLLDRKSSYNETALRKHLECYHLLEESFANFHSRSIKTFKSAFADHINKC